MEKGINIDSERLKFIIDGGNVAVKKTKLIIFFIVSLALFLILLAILGEVTIIGIFLLLFFFKPIQTTEIHFNTVTKTIITSYSFYGKIIKKRKVLNDYSICSYSVVSETIIPYEESYHVFTLRATEFYYHYNLYHFKEKDDAILIRNWLLDNLDIMEESLRNKSHLPTTLKNQ